MLLYLEITDGSYPMKEQLYSSATLKEKME
jgi:hypothetical protein